MVADSFDIPAWIALFGGLYVLAASAAELRAPGTWDAMLDDFDRLTGLRFATGVFVLALGAAIYLVNPWRPEDWLAIVISALGGLLVAEGVLLIAAGERLMKLSRRLIGRSARAWAGVAALIGIAFILVALARI